MFEPKDILPTSHEPGLPPELEGIGRGLRSYYQLADVGPTPKRLQMLLDELLRRAAAYENGNRSDEKPA